MRIAAVIFLLLLAGSGALPTAPKKYTRRMLVEPSSVDNPPKELQLTNQRQFNAMYKCVLEDDQEDSYITISNGPSGTSGTSGTDTQTVYVSSNNGPTSPQAKNQTGNSGKSGAEEDIKSKMYLPGVMSENGNKQLGGVSTTGDKAVSADNKEGDTKKLTNMEDNPDNPVRTFYGFVPSREVRKVSMKPDEDWLIKEEYFVRDKKNPQHL